MQQEGSPKYHRNICLTCPQTPHTEPIQSHTDMKHFTLRPNLRRGIRPRPHARAHPSSRQNPGLPQKFHLKPPYTPRLSPAAHTHTSPWSYGYASPASARNTHPSTTSSSRTHGPSLPSPPPTSSKLSQTLQTSPLPSPPSNSN
jgi:hypothetical protein